VLLHQILFLNKDDLFQKKILNSDIKNFFPASYFLPIGSSYSMYSRITRVNQGTQKLDESTSGGVSRGSLTKPDVPKSAKFTSSTSFLVFTEDSALTPESVTTATDTEMLRVVMAAVEGQLLCGYL
jgi:hypothetical protein